MDKSSKNKKYESKLISNVEKEKLMFPEVQEIMAGLKVGLCRDEVYAFCLDIVKSRLMLESIKQNASEEDLKKM